jgi:hypothetical protein
MSTVQIAGQGLIGGQGFAHEVSVVQQIARRIATQSKLWCDNQQATWIIHLSDGAAFCRHFRRLAGHFLARGMVTTHVECRRLPQLPWPSAVRSGFNPKMVLSTTLKDEDIDYLYSETVALDL